MNNIMPEGDYYVWYCEWCDSRNHTLWTWFEEGKVLCGACHNALAMHPHVTVQHRSCIL